MSIVNRKWILKERPQGLVKDSDFELVTETLPPIQEGEILLENMYLSFDPTQRGWLNDVPGYLPPVQIGEVVRFRGMKRLIYQLQNCMLLEMLLAEAIPLLNLF